MRNHSWSGRKQRFPVYFQPTVTMSHANTLTQDRGTPLRDSQRGGGWQRRTKIRCNFMKENNITRRTFFKHATNKLLPMLGVLVVSSAPMIKTAAAKLTTMSCDGNCWGKCEDSCTDTCFQVCGMTCTGKCDGSCKGGCFSSCAIGCKTTCRGTCELSCVFVSWI